MFWLHDFEHSKAPSIQTVPWDSMQYITQTSFPKQTEGSGKEGKVCLSKKVLKGSRIGDTWKNIYPGITNIHKTQIRPITAVFQGLLVTQRAGCHLGTGGSDRWEGRTGGPGAAQLASSLFHNSHLCGWVVEILHPWQFSYVFQLVPIINKGPISLWSSSSGQALVAWHTIFTPILLPLTAISRGSFI